jgi:hypothetical protein
LFDGFHDGFPNWKDSWCCGGESEPKGNHSMTSSRDKLLLPFQHDSFARVFDQSMAVQIGSSKYTFELPSSKLFFVFHSLILVAGFSWTNSRQATY